MSWVPFTIDPSYSGDAQPRDPRERLPSIPPSPDFYEIVNNRLIHNLKIQVSDLEDEVLKLKATEIETQGTIKVLRQEVLETEGAIEVLKREGLETKNTMEILKRERLKQNDRVSALQELVMELCDKAGLYGGSEAYWEVKDEL